mgnify:CR=1 FL=1
MQSLCRLAREDESARQGRVKEWNPRMDYKVGELISYLVELLKDAAYSYKGGDRSGIAEDATTYDGEILVNYSGVSYVIRVTPI